MLPSTDDIGEPAPLWAFTDDARDQSNPAAHVCQLNATVPA
jgi:hypothetical protein